MKNTLDLLKENGYLTSVELDSAAVRHPELVVELAGKITNCGVVRPRYAVKSTDLEKFEQKTLPAKGIGLIILTTSKGLMTNVQAKKANQGGRLLAYVY